MFQADLLAGKRVLITGGGSGLGKSTAERLLELGAEVAICGRREAVLAETKAELEARTGGRVAIHACDIRDPAAV
jgi:NAD(P)-dependent dehydrogenase (short-subunit alcohol dehydrogenase family)